MINKIELKYCHAAQSHNN